MKWRRYVFRKWALDGSTTNDSMRWKKNYNISLSDTEETQQLFGTSDAKGMQPTFILKQGPLLKSVSTPIQGSESIVLGPWFGGTPHPKVTSRQRHQHLSKTNYAGPSECTVIQNDEKVGKNH